MGTTAQKLAYLNETKTKIKNAINLGEAGITDETFRQYEKGIKQALLNTINDKWSTWNNFEKVTGTGENISVNQIVHAPMALTLKGNTSQFSTTGKNLQRNYLSGNSTLSNGVSYKINDDKSITLNGTGNGTLSYLRIYGDYELQAGTYTLSNHNLNASQSTAIYYDDNSNFNPRNQEETKTFTEAVVIKPYIRVNGNYTYNNFTIYPMIESGSSATDYEPYTNGASPNPDYPQQIHEVSGDNEVVVRGKNLAQHIAGWIRNDGIFVSSNDDCFYFPVIQGETYTFNSSGNRTISAIFNDIPTQGAECISGTYLSLFKNTPFQASATGIMVIYGNTPSSQSVIDDFIAVKGSVVGDYKPYQSQTYPIYLGIQNIADFKNINYTTSNNAVVSRNDGEYTITSSSSKWASCRFTQTNLNLKPNTTYTFSAKVKNTNTANGSSVYIYSGGSSTGSAVQGTLAKDGEISYITFTTPSTITSNADILGLIVNEENKETIFTDIMLELGNTYHRYYPYGKTPIELCKIGNYQDYFTKNSGKNIVNPNNIVQGIINDSNGNLEGTAISNNKSIDYTEIKPNTSYYFLSNKTSGNWGAWYDENKTYISGISLGATIDGVKVSPSNAKYLRFTLDREGNNDNYLSNVMICEGTSRTTYEPYGTGQWCKYNAIREVVLDGTNYPFSGEYGQRTNGYVVYVSQLVTDHSLGGISNKFVFSNLGISSMPLYTFGGNSGAITTFSFVLPSTITSLSQANEWLTANNTTIYYVLSTPYLSLIEDETLISQLDNIKNAMSYEGTTNIGQVNNDKPFIIDAIAIKQF